MKKPWLVFLRMEIAALQGFYTRHSFQTFLDALQLGFPGN